MTNYEIIQEVNKGLPELLNAEPLTKVIMTAMQRAIELTRSDDVQRAVQWFKDENSHAVAQWLDYECEKLRKAME